MTTRSMPAATLTRNQGYSLLYELISDESKVDAILIIKESPPATKEVIKAIAARMKVAKEAIENFKKADPTLVLDAADLPTVEKETRASISSMTAKELLAASGPAFRLDLLLTQYEALKYLSALSRTLAKQEKDPPRKAMLEELSADSKELHRQIVAQLAG